MVPPLLSNQNINCFNQGGRPAGGAHAVPPLPLHIFMGNYQHYFLLQPINKLKQKFFMEEVIIKANDANTNI